MKNIFKIFLTSLSLLLATTKLTLAACPVCVVAVGAGLGLSEYLGIDDTIAGVWIGGLIISLIIWTINWFNKKDWLNHSASQKTWRNILIFIIYYAMVIWPLLNQGFIGDPANSLFGLDKLLLGIIGGSLIFIGANAWYENIKKKNNNHAWFPFQKIVWPFGALVILSGLFYCLILFS